MKTDHITFTTVLQQLEYKFLLELILITKNTSQKQTGIGAGDLRTIEITTDSVNTMGYLKYELDKFKKEKAQVQQCFLAQSATDNIPFLETIQPEKPIKKPTPFNANPKPSPVHVPKLKMFKDHERDHEADENCTIQNSDNFEIDPF